MQDKESEKSSSIARSATEAPENADDTSDGPASEDTESTDDDQVALPPTAIAGGFLTCEILSNADPLELGCRAENPVGIAWLPEQVKSSFARTSDQESWRKVPTTFDAQRQLFLLALTGFGEASVQVLMIMNDGHVLVDAIERNSTLSANLVRNGGFEDYIVEQGSTNSRFTSTQSDSWKAEPAETNNCADGIAYIEAQLGGLLPSVGGSYAGEKNTELDSGCTTGTGGNIFLYQDIATKPGYVYHLQFWYKKRSTVSQTVEVKLGPVIVFSRTNEALQWTRTSITFIANSDSTRLMFTDRGASDGQGSLLDQVEFRHVEVP